MNENDYASFLFCLYWPFDMIVRRKDGSVFLPPLDVIDRLVGIYMEKEGDPDLEGWRWAIEAELDTDVWSKG